METSFSKAVVRSFLWTSGGQLIGQTVSWLVTLVVVRLLSSADYGLMAMAGVLPGLFLLIADLGLSSATIQAPDLNRDQLRGMFGLVLASNGAGCLLLLAGAPLLAQFFGEPRLVSLIRVLSLNFVLIAAYTLPQAQLVRRLDFKTKARIDLASVLAGVAAALGLALTGLGVWALVWSLLVQHGVRAVAYNVAAPIGVLPGKLGAGFRPLATFGFVVLADRLLFYLYSQLDILIGGRVLGKEAIGIYAVALSLATVPLDKVLPVVTQVSFAAFSRIQSDPDRVRRNLMRAIQAVALVCFPAFLGLAAVAPDFVPLILGPRWLGLILPLQLLCLVLPFKALGALFPPVLFGIGRPGVNVGNVVLSVVVMTVALLIGVRYGIIGLCLAWVIAFPCVLVVVLRRSLRALGLTTRDLLERAALPVIASLTMAGVVLGAAAALPAGPSVVRLCLLLGLGIAVYVTILAIWGRRETGELLAVLRP
jgi:teichuronic acid exporter